MNDNLIEIAFIPGTRMKAVRSKKQGLSDDATIRATQAPMDVLREEEEGKSR